MHTRREKTACLAIVIMLLLSEIYLNMVMTDSFLRTNLQEHQTLSFNQVLWILFLAKY